MNYSLNKFIKDWVIPLGTALLLVFLIYKFVFFNILVPTQSMVPTIMPNDRIFVTRIYKTDNLKRDDIVVFYSEERKEKLIKRLIGLPGDKVEVKEDGSVFINNIKKEELYVINKGGPTGNFIVPEGHYLFLGDNRADSLDARYWKNPYIPTKDILGKARFIFYPFKRMGKLK